MMWVSSKYYSPKKLLDTKERMHHIYTLYFMHKQSLALQLLLYCSQELLPMWTIRRDAVNYIMQLHLKGQLPNSALEKRVDGCEDLVILLLNHHRTEIHQGMQSITQMLQNKISLHIKLTRK